MFAYELSLSLPITGTHLANGINSLSRIKRYEAMDYMAAIKIVDMGTSSWWHDHEEIK
jgi:hypothetical protein